MDGGCALLLAHAESRRLVVCVCMRACLRACVLACVRACVHARVVWRVCTSVVWQHFSIAKCAAFDLRKAFLFDALNPTGYYRLDLKDPPMRGWL